MNRAEYLSQEEVAAFVGWFAERLPGLADWFRGYGWPFTVNTLAPCTGSTFDESAAVLSQLSAALRRAMAEADMEDLRDACIAVMEWGGVRSHNVRWLQNHAKELPGLLTEGCLVMKQNEDSKTGRIGRFNAGMTKVYSLLLDDFVIYDSRVAAALAHHVKTWRNGTGRAHTGDSLLAFPCMPAKEYRYAVTRKCRNPDPEVFPWMHNNAIRHAQWNLRASWILVEVMQQDQQRTFQVLRPDAPLRALEAALFMMGYDLNQLSAPGVRHAPTAGARIILA